MATAPWSGWGQTKIDTYSMSPTSKASVTNTLARVAYKRPEAWRFLLAGQIVRGSVGDCEITIDFDLILGLGRASIELKDFARLKWLWPVGNPPTATLAVTATTRLSQMGTSPEVSAVVDTLIAESIICSARVRAEGDAGKTADVAISAFFSPCVHVRPDWYADGTDAEEVSRRRARGQLMSASRIRGFLLQQPRPARVRVTGADGEPQELRPGRSYARAAESIQALGADLIEALDSEGHLLRAMRLSSVESRRSEAAEIPDAIKTDPHALMLTHFANLVHRAYEHSTEVAFQKIVEIVERLSAHTESIEARLEKTEAAHRPTIEEQIQDAFDRAEEAASKSADGGDSFVQQMATAFLSGQMSGGATPKNGKHPAPAKG